MKGFAGKWVEVISRIWQIARYFLTVLSGEDHWRTERVMAAGAEIS